MKEAEDAGFETRGSVATCGSVMEVGGGQRVPHEGPGGCRSLAVISDMSGFGQTWLVWLFLP